MDKTARKGLHWMDWVLLAVLTLLIFAAVWFLNSRKTAEVPETRSMSYTVLLANMPMEQEGILQIGGAVYNSNNGNYLGTLKEIRYEPAKTVKYNGVVGAYVELSDDQRYDAYVTITNEGYETEKDFVIGGYSIKVGDELNIRGKGYAGAGVVAGLDVEEQP